MYYPDSRSHQASRNRPGHPFSDTGFPISSNNPTNVFSTRQPNQHQPISYGSEVSRKKIAIIHVFSHANAFLKHQFNLKFNFLIRKNRNTYKIGCKIQRKSLHSLLEDVLSHKVERDIPKALSTLTQWVLT